MKEAEEILSRLESRGRSFRGAFCLAIAGLATLVVAKMNMHAPDVIRAKTLAVVDGKDVLGTVSTYEHKVVMGTMLGKTNLFSIGEGPTGAGVLAVAASTGTNVVRLTTAKSGGGSVGVNGPTGNEIANASPNVTNAGSLFIDNSAGALIGEINGDKVNGGAIIVHDSKGAETARVHQ